MNTRNKSSLNNSVHTTRLFKKIKDLHASSDRRIIFELDGKRYGADECTLVVIDENAHTIDYTDPDSVAQSKVLADVYSITRIRSRKYVVRFK